MCFHIFKEPAGRCPANLPDIDTFPIPFFPAIDQPLLCAAFLKPGQEADKVVRDPDLPFFRRRRHERRSGIYGDKREVGGE